MPRYLYRCDCGVTQSIVSSMQKISTNPSVLCYHCGNTMRRVFTVPQLCTRPFLFEEGNIRPRLVDPNTGKKREMSLRGKDFKDWANYWDSRYEINMSPTKPLTEKDVLMEDPGDSNA